jgi:hypothetical protein
MNQRQLRKALGLPDPDPSTLIYPDVVFFFPTIPKPENKNQYYSEHFVSSWCWDRGWLPKDSNGHINVCEGQKAEIWSGRSDEGCQYVALKFV